MQKRMIADIARSLRALSHPRRVMLFQLLVEEPDNERCFQSLQSATGLRTTPLVHHLREMERARLLVRRRKGSHAYYRLTPSALTTAFDHVLGLLDNKPTPELAA